MSMCDVYISVHILTCAHGGLKRTSDVFLHRPPLASLRLGLSRNQKLDVLTKLADQRTLKTHLSPPSALLGLQAPEVTPSFLVSREAPNPGPHTFTANSNPADSPGS